MSRRGGSERECGDLEQLHDCSLVAFKNPHAAALDWTPTIPTSPVGKRLFIQRLLYGKPGDRKSLKQQMLLFILALVEVNKLPAAPSRLRRPAVEECAHSQAGGHLGSLPLASCFHGYTPAPPQTIRTLRFNPSHLAHFLHRFMPLGVNWKSQLAATSVAFFFLSLFFFTSQTESNKKMWINVAAGWKHLICWSGGVKLEM